MFMITFLAPATYRNISLEIILWLLSLAFFCALQEGPGPRCLEILRHSLCTLRQWKWREIGQFIIWINQSACIVSYKDQSTLGRYFAPLSLAWARISRQLPLWVEEKFISSLKTFLPVSMFYLAKLALKGFHSHKDLWFHKVSNVSSLKKFVTCTISSVVQSSSYSNIHRNLFFKSRASMNF